MTEHQCLETIAVGLDEKADDLFTDIANDTYPSRKKEHTIKAQAYRRAAEIIRYQIECEV